MSSLEALKEFAAKQARNYEKLPSSHVIGFNFNGMFIVNPFWDESGLEEVDPKAYYGEHYDQWLADYQAMVIDRAHANNSGS